MMTMVLGGLWHGAAWTFVLWGAFHGAGLCTEHALDGRIGRRTPAWLRWFVTFNLVCFGWILFRSQTSTLFWTFLGRLVDPGPATLLTCPVVLMIAVVIGMQLLPPRPRGAPAAADRAACGRWCSRSALAAMILIVGATVPSQGVPPVHLLPVLSSSVPR